MGQSIPSLEEDKNNPPPKTPPTVPEKHPEEGDIDIKYIRSKRKPLVPSAEFFTGPPEYVLPPSSVVTYSCRQTRTAD